MIRQALLFKGIALSNTDFKLVMETATDDIKFNQIELGKRINLDGVIEILLNCVKTLERCS
jgi:hypothetical protein